MSRNTSVTLGDHLSAFVDNSIQSGRFESTSEAVRAGLRLLEEQETKLDILRQALIEGEESGESPYSHAEIIAQAKAELNAE